MTDPRTAAVITAERDRQVAAALAQAPANIAALITRSRLRLTLALALHTIFTANRREEIIRAAGYFDGLVFALNMSGDLGSAWTAAEWNALEDYGPLAEATALARLEA